MGFDRIAHEVALPRPPELAPMTALPPRITILLSVFNGEKYLDAQLESILNQNGVDWRLCWRDDGSSDSSCAIMEAFARRAGAERCLRSASSGLHLGAAASFLRLLAENQNCGFVAFADQDDCWLPGKLQRSLQLLGEPEDGPALYCARQTLTDEAFEHPTPSMKFRGQAGFPASLTQNVATGNTVVINEAACRLIAAIPLPDASPHDWWSYIVVSACGGRVVYDEQSSMLYRQHSRNMIGSPVRGISRALAALQRGPDIYMTMMRRHVERLYEVRHRLHPQAVADLQLIRKGLNGGLLARLAALRCPRFTRATLAETLLFRWWFLRY